MKGARRSGEVPGDPLRIVRECTDSSVLRLILLPTEACNFRCTYCYEDFRLKGMDPALVAGLERWIASRVGGLRDLRLTWFGGEPLLARETVERLMLHARALAADHPQLRVRSDMTTNGYLLTPDVFDRLVALGITQYQITFDGPREWHDKKRVRANGGATFDRIWNNLLATRDRTGEFEIVVRLHVNRENQGAIPQFIDDYNRSFAEDPRYRLFLRKLERLGGPNDDTLPILAGPSADSILAGLGRRNAGRSVATEPLSVSVCYAARTNSFVVRADGRLGKCTVALNDPANDVGRLLEDGTVKFDRQRLQPWFRGLWSADVPALRCPWHGLSSESFTPLM